MTEENKRPQQNGTGCLIAFIAVLLILFIGIKGFIAFWDSLGDSSSNMVSSSTSSDYKVDAYVMSQEFMEDYLKSPQTAKYPWYSDINVVQTGNRYKVEAYVDSQNDFGVTVRTKYYMILERSEDGGWTKISCDIK